MQHIIFDSFSLSELKDNNLKSHDIQRGLVWTPKQIEQLWDSIFKGFPIGTIMLLKKENDKQILDGLQRLNAISLGFQDCNNQNLEKIIWINFHEHDNYSFMVTTMSHPWGYNDDEDCSKLTADEQRFAVKSFLGEEYKEGDEWNIYSSDNLKLNCTWPHKAKLAIPLQVLTKAIMKKEEEYLQCVKSLFKIHFAPAYNHFVKKNDENKLDKAIESIHESIQNVLDYKIGATIITLKPIVDIEILFNRINKGGSQISDDELAYSTIKAYFPFVKKDETEAKVEKYIEPSKLARIIFRIIETKVENKRDGFVNNLSL